MLRKKSPSRERAAPGRFYRAFDSASGAVELARSQVDTLGHPPMGQSSGNGNCTHALIRILPAINKNKKCKTDSSNEIQGTLP
jgi:hypothetical protein